MGRSTSDAIQQKADLSTSMLESTVLPDKTSYPTLPYFTRQIQNTTGLRCGLSYKWPRSTMTVGTLSHLFCPFSAASRFSCAFCFSTFICAWRVNVGHMAYSPRSLSQSVCNTVSPPLPSQAVHVYRRLTVVRLPASAKWQKFAIKTATCRQRAVGSSGLTTVLGCIYSTCTHRER